MAIIGQRFGINLTRLHLTIKQADLIALATEKRDLMPYSTEPWSYLTGVDPLSELITPMEPFTAKSAFLEAFARLTKEVQPVPNIAAEKIMGLTS